MSRLWAKRWSGPSVPECAYLPGHLQCVYQAAEAILELTGKCQLDALGLEPNRWFERFRRIVLAAAAIHDLGKANDHFQGMICGKRRVPQALRHEWVAYLLLNMPDWNGWFQSAFRCSGEQDWRISLWAVTGHHPASTHPSPPNKTPDGTGSQMTLLLGHDDFRSAAKWIAEQLGLSPPPESGHIRLALTVTSSGNALKQINKAFCADCEVWHRLDDDTRKLVAAAKACLIAADVAGSALPGKLDPTRAANWLTDVLTTAPDANDLRAVVRDRLGSHSPRRFQTEVAHTASRVSLLLAGCGSGKTIAAYLWAASRAADRRIYLCYPTTGTATEGFRDYLFDPAQSHGKYGARLFHSRLEADLEMLLHAPGESQIDEEHLRIDSLLSWSTPIVCCTVDTVLGLLQNQRRGLYAWPALAQSAFVFDEIHAYDERLFGALLRFLNTMRGVPVLLMTASLPQSQHAALKQCLNRCGEELTEIRGPSDMESLKRYQLLSSDQPEAVVREELRRGGKVLWVCNTVDRAIEVAERLSDSSPLVYHSRFRYEDRVARHAEVIECFRRDEPALAVCTQVAEMSLDLSATLLVTDLAPVPALIQRLGRLNRRALPPPPGQPPPPPKPLLVVEPHTPDGSTALAPYDQDTYGDWPQIARTWLTLLDPGPVSQRDLAQAWQGLQTGNPPCPVASAWLDGGPRTTVDTVRDCTPGITVIMDGQDADDVRAGRKSPARVALPMPPPPKRYPWRSWDRIRGLLIAPAGTIAYDPQRGARWQRNEPNPPKPDP